MPYIKQARRDALRKNGHDMEGAGELNYLLTRLALLYIEQRGGVECLSYQMINDIIGAFEGAKMEFYRRIAVPYEQSKIRTNGDVYPL